MTCVELVNAVPQGLLLQQASLIEEQVGLQGAVAVRVEGLVQLALLVYLLDFERALSLLFSAVLPGAEGQLRVVCDVGVLAGVDRLELQPTAASLDGLPTEVALQVLQRQPELFLPSLLLAVAVAARQE